MKKNKSATLIIIVAALGYFVDIYDLILFSIIRKKSLIALGISEADCLTVGEHLISMQMYGMLVGGLLWGILGDKKGRLSVLFGSILMYSVANIANGMIQTVEAYAIWRFIAGVGLAGELGAGITLVSESMSKEHRGYGTMAIVSFGVLGGVMAAAVGTLIDNWRMAYYIGGAMGLMLLLLRIGVFESGMYHAAKNAQVQRGNFLMLLSDSGRFFKYLGSISIGIPIWFLIGILVTFSKEFSDAIGVSGIQSAISVGVFYGATSLGDFSSGYISQRIKSRKKVVFGFLMMTLLGIPLYLFNTSKSPVVFYAICAFLGFAAGYWAIFVTIASEQFGTNLRATVTTTVPNFVRGCLPLLIICFKTLREGFGNTAIPFFKSQEGTWNNNAFIYSALIVGVLTVLIAMYSLYTMDETYHKDLDYLEY
jgi:putative MFS transporter